MFDALKGILELVPIIRDAPAWFRVMFLAWIILSAALGIGLVVLKVVSPPSAASTLSVALTPNQYIDARQIALEGKGLPPGDGLSVRVRRVHDGVRDDVTLPPGRALIRGAAGAWRFEWIVFEHAGPHEVLVEQSRDGKQVDFVGPVPIQVGAWVAAPSTFVPEHQPEHPVAIGPSGIDLSQFTVIHDQGEEGTSPSLAFVTAMEIGLRRANSGRTLSARYLYEKAKLHDDLGSKSEGTWMTAIVYVAEQFGVPAESEWPYRAGTRDLPPGTSWARLDELAAHTKARTFRLQSLDDIPAQLRLGRAVVVGVRIFESSFYGSAVSRTGDVAVPGPDEQPVGLHAVAIVGYDPALNALRFANSWGSAWGAAGFGSFSHEAAERCLDVDQMWAVEPRVGQ